MKRKDYLKRLISIWLMTALIVTSGELAAFASIEDNEDVLVSTETEEGVENKSDSDVTESDGQMNNADIDSSEESTVDAESAAEDTADAAGEEVPPVIYSFSVAKNACETITFTWEPIPTAAYYMVYLDESGYRCNDIEDCKYTFNGLDGVHRFSVEAFDTDGNRLTGSDTLSVMTFNENVRSRISSRTISGSGNLGINLRTLIGEAHNGYAVVQGGCTDGTFAYYLMVSSATQKGRVLKLRISDNKVIKTSDILNIHHGNGMTYDARRNQLVVVARESRKQELTAIDANSLTIKKQENVKYNYFKDAKSGALSPTHQSRGLAAIAYNKRYDVYLALEREYHNILIFDPDTFEAKGIAFTSITSKYPGTYQAMDADDRYVYLVQSYYDSSQPYNQLLVLDWNSENLLDIVNGAEGTPDYVEKGWYCNNNGSGTPDAVIRLGTAHEAENLYHTTDASGREHFYLSEYFNNPQYKKVTEKVAYKVKWKKVKKKVKWKRVKKKGKWKWKYKKVKVWKYKTKYKNVTRTVLSHYNRDNYVYDLGIF